MSVLLLDEKRNKCVLYAKGDGQSMKGVINFSSKDRIIYKQLMANYKMNGLKSLVIAKKELPTVVYESFVTNFRLVSKMTRNQQENFEKLAVEIETNLRFVGCLGFKDNIDKDVYKLTGQLRDSKIKVLMLTGDNLDNSLIAAKSLKLSKSNFNDSSSYYSLRFRSELEGHAKLKRILEFLYENLKVISIFKTTQEDAEKGSRRFNQGPRRASNQPFDSKTGIQWTLLRKALKAVSGSSSPVKRRPLRLQGGKKTNSTGGKPFRKRLMEEDKKLFKTLLINGSSVEFLMRSESLKNHFCFVLYFCENLVGYSLDSKHKSFLVKCLRMTSSSLILAVGDGFNDMAMLKEAHVGVQLADPDLPLIFGDIVISDFS